MTTTPCVSVNASDPADILGAVPHLLGFPPSESLVLITLHDVNSQPRLGLAMRADIPQPQHRRRLARQVLNGPVAPRQPEAVMLIVVGHGPPLPEGTPTRTSACHELPQTELVEAFQEVFGVAGIPVVHSTWIKEIRQGCDWYCYEDEECHGTLADPMSSPLAAAMATAGNVTYGSRAELAALVAPESEETIARTSARIDAVCAEQEAEHDPAATIRRDIEVVLGAVRRQAEGAALTEDDYFRVLLAVSDTRVRDLAMSTALGDWAAAAEQLWLALVRKAPPPEVAEVASLLAFSAYLRGNGSLASVALERIETTRPDHQLGKLLRHALDTGLSQETLSYIAKEMAGEAQALCDQDGAA